MNLPLTMATAGKIANELTELLEPACEQVLIAGSIRRKWATRMQPEGAAQIVNDVEIVCVPRPGVDRAKLFSEPGEACALENLLAEWRAKYIIADDPDLKRDGPRAKHFIYCRLAKVDLFIVRPPATWGAMVAIRTGNTDFSRLLVTSTCKGGAMPQGLRCHSGGLCRLVHHQGDEASECTALCRIDTPTESSFFAALGLPLDAFPPGERDERHLASFLARHRRAHAGSLT